MLAQIEIEKINNCIESKFIELIKVLNSNNLTNEILPQNKIDLNHFICKQYSNVLNSLNENYKKFLLESNNMNNYSNNNFCFNASNNEIMNHEAVSDFKNTSCDVLNVKIYKEVFLKY